MELQDQFFKVYKELDLKFNTYADNSYEYLVNFSQTKDTPVHRWFYYPEGYSPLLVKNILDHLKLNKKNISGLDPFAGSGTTLVTFKELGISSVGIEINPFSAFITKTKTRNYTDEEIRKLKEFNIPKCKPYPNVYDKYELKIIKNLFDREKLEKIELLKKEIAIIQDTKLRDLLFFALLSILEDVSNYRKGGNGLKKKRVKKDLDPFIEFDNKIQQIYEDLKKVKPGVEPKIINDSCLNIQKYNIDEVDISIFSPPYANCFDPFEVYKIELWVGEFVSSYAELKEKRKTALTSNLNADVKKGINTTHRTELLSNLVDYLSKKNLWDKRIPKMLDTYFYEMYNVLKLLYDKTKKGGYCVIVVGNSAYGKIAIPTDILLGQMGEKVGFKVKEIIVGRRNETSSQQHKKLGNLLEYLRESLIILQK